MIAGQGSNFINYNKILLYNLKFQSFDTLMSRPRQKIPSSPPTTTTESQKVLNHNLCGQEIIKMWNQFHKTGVFVV